LIRSTTERPRTSWSQLLRGPQKIRLSAKLSNFILDVFSFARPNMTILQYASRDAVHQNGVFEARWELVYLTSDGATPAGTAMVSDCPPLVDTRSPVRDIIIRMMHSLISFSSEVNCADLFNIIFRRPYRTRRASDALSAAIKRSRTTAF